MSTSTTTATTTTKHTSQQLLTEVPVVSFSISNFGNDQGKHVIKVRNKNVGVYGRFSFIEHNHHNVIAYKSLALPLKT